MCKNKTLTGLKAYGVKRGSQSQMLLYLIYYWPEELLSFLKWPHWEAESQKSQKWDKSALICFKAALVG